MASETLIRLRSALDRIIEVEELVFENRQQSMLHRHLSHIKTELRRQIRIESEEDLAPLLDAL
tara:strand:+ start:12555 stop:12743 length:189 start_codon:yes stop_codon:yes gene_type:complete